MNENHPIIEVFYKGTRWSLVPGGRDAISYFGGPHTDHITSSVDLGSAVLHHIATINLPKFGVGNMRFGFAIPLFYGPCHEGCVIEYRKTATAAIEITSMTPAEAQEDFPYPGYPPLLPYYRLGISGSSKYEHATLSDRVFNTGWEVKDDCFYVIVMQHPAVGHCLFEPGDDVEIVFEFDPNSGVIRGTNQCT